MSPVFYDIHERKRQMKILWKFMNGWSQVKWNILMWMIFPI